MMGIRKSQTTPYHPEIFNRTLLSMLGTLNQGKKRQWSHHVVHLVHAYNSTKCDSTGYSPYFLMFGREARLPVDVCFGTHSDDKRVTFQNLKPGDRVLLKNLAFKGKHKLQNRWCDIPYVVEEKMPNLPVYKLKPESGKREVENPTQR